MWQSLFGRSAEQDNTVFEKLEGCSLPKHTAIIMDGNGRWAKLRGLARTAGHTAGVNTLRNIIKAAVDLKLEALTVYAFSTENWKRPAPEVDFLMTLFYDYLKKEIAEMKRDNVKLRFLGRIDELPIKLSQLAYEAVDELKDNKGLALSVAMNYGGQDELLRAVRKIVAINKDKDREITLQDVENNLDTAGLPQVDLIIRTSGDLRLSNFLIWQTAYAEFWATEKNWPDFTPEDFIQALYDFSHRERRFGGVEAVKC